MSIGLRYFEEVEIAFLNYEGAIEGLEVLEIRRRFSLFINGDSDLDQRLAEAPEVRLQFVSNLMALVLVLGTGRTLLSLKRVMPLKLR